MHGLYRRRKPLIVFRPKLYRLCLKYFLLTKFSESLICLRVRVIS